MDFFNSDLFITWLLPFVIFFARIADVTIGTVRIIMLSKGLKLWAPILGFFEVLIWILVIGKIMQNAGSLVSYIAYAAGFATGNYIGMRIEEKLAIGYLVLRVITAKPADELILALNKEGVGATYLNAQGSEGPVHIVFSIIKRTDLKSVINEVKVYNPKAFYSIEDIRSVNFGIFPSSKKSKVWLSRRKRK